MEWRERTNSGGTRCRKGLFKTHNLYTVKFGMLRVDGNKERAALKRERESERGGGERACWASKNK